MRFKLLVCFCFLVSGALFSAQIQLAPNPGPAEKYAREELEKYTTMLLGKPALSPAFNLFIDNELEEEEWSIKSKTENVEISGGSGRGLLYGVYHYLEDYCGVRFLSHDAEYIPKLDKLPDKDLNLSGKPTFPVRILSSTIPNDNEYWVKCRLNRLGWSSPGIAKFGGLRNEGRPAPCHTFAYYLPTSKYFKTNPEYFAMNIDGERVGGDQYRGQPCLSNQTVRKIFLEKLKEYIESDIKRAKEHAVPSPQVYDITQNDNQVYCRCKDCNDLAARYGGTQSGIMLDFVNELADGIKELYPNLTLQTFAYQYTEELPTNIKARPNVSVIVCTTRRNLAQPLTDESNIYYQRLFEEWSKIAKVSVWNYADTYCTPKNLPIASEFGFAEDFKFYKKYNLHRCGSENSQIFYPEVREYKAYLMYHLMEDPYQDIEKLKKDFATGYYGPAAKLFLQYREIIKASQERHDSFMPMYPYGAGMYPHLDLDTVSKAQELFTEGRKLLKDDPVLLRRWNLAALGIDRAALARRVALIQEHIRQGGNIENFPLDLATICERARKTHLGYIDGILATLKNRAGEDPKLIENFERQKLRWQPLFSEIAAEHDSFAEPVNPNELKIPEKFANENPQDVYVFFPSQMSRMNMIKDDDSFTGEAAQLLPHKSLSSYKDFPPSCNIFSYHSWKGRFAYSWEKEDVKEPGYHWIKMGKITHLTSSCTFVPGTWALLIPVADAYDAKKPNIFESWLYVKTEGPEYDGSDSNQENRLLIGALALVRTTNQEVVLVNQKNFSADKINCMGNSVRKSLYGISAVVTENLDDYAFANIRFKWEENHPEDLLQFTVSAALTPEVTEGKIGAIIYELEKGEVKQIANISWNKVIYRDEFLSYDCSISGEKLRDGADHMLIFYKMQGTQSAAISNVKMQVLSTKKINE